MYYIKNLKDYGFNTENRTYIIAEIGINHGGDVKTARALIESAANTGADAVKFQTYISEKRAPKGMPEIYDILKKCELPFEVFGELKKHAEKHRLDFLSTPFDSGSVAYLESINCHVYKIASSDVVNHKLLDDISKTKKPVIMSVGMASMGEIESAYEILKKGTDKITLLHCICAYPMKEDDANLSVINVLREKFADCIIGYSDHSNDIVLPLCAAAAGAQVIEKHFKINENMDCVDGPVSITEAQMKKLVYEIRKLEKYFGDGALGLREAEKGTELFRRHTSVSKGNTK